ncbi:MAG: acyl-CoA dehydrogenase family protein [Acidimicrobiales bacterium]
MPATTEAVPDLAAARAALAAGGQVRRSAAHLARQGPGAIDANQVVAYDLAHAAAGLEVGRAALAYGVKGPTEARLAAAFVADAIWDLKSRLLGREAAWDLDVDLLEATRSFVAAHRDPAFLAALAEEQGERHLDGDLELVAATFRRFAEERIAPLAERIHRENTDLPEDLIAGLGELGAFGLSIPEEYGGFATGDGRDHLGMVIATEELSRASLGAGGSLITRPEILARALVKGGTEEQKRRWLPPLASGEIMAAVAVTEPDYGSDVAGIAVAARPDGDDWVVSGTKTWSTFAARADVLMLLARTDPDRALDHRGLSLFMVAKERADGRGFALTQPGGGRLEGRPIDTIGYRGMHSYELAFDSWRVPGENLIGGDAGRGRGFYLQMGGFESGRLQTAARAVGVMQAAFEAASAYAANRRVFGRALAAHQLTSAKLGRMAAMIQAARQYMYEVGRLMASSEGALEASMIKAYVCRAAEWVTREAMQIHGGMGYAEEYLVSRLFVDARVLSIFEGSDETLALKVIARRLVEQPDRFDR